ncbi:MAG: type I methionyl aminopeptidase [Patescibacteria group bacterium]
MIIKNKQQRKTYKEACHISTQILRELYNMLEVGLYPIEVDKRAFELCKKWDVIPSFYGVQGKKSKYQHATCIQINDAVVHGIPSKTDKIKDGDLVTVDFGIIYEGFYTDHAFTVGIGNVNAEDKRLLKIAKDTVLAAVQLAKVDAMTGDLGNIMISKAQKNGFDTAKKYVGHGIGKRLHEYPEIPTFGIKNTGMPLRKGMVLCIEAQLMIGSDELKNDKDNWTVRTKDGSKSVMFEYMVEVGKNGPKILTDTSKWELVKS